MRWRIGMVDSERQVALAALEAEVKACTECGLCQGRTNAVPGEGDLDAVVMFIGEGPGQDEDLQGRPFVGRSGQLLTQMLQEAGIDRASVYITNVVKCRPPGNRDPLPGEIEACRGFLERQIALINPRIIVTLGRFSMQRWLPGERITRIQGKARNIGRGRCVIPLFHPAAVLRNPNWMHSYREVFSRLPNLIQRAMHANERARRGEVLPAGVPHPGDPDYQDPAASPPLTQQTLF